MPRIPLSNFALAAGLWMIALASGCEPGDQPGAELAEVRVSLEGRNPGGDGRYALQVGERARVVATGRYLNGREEVITLALFWKLEPGDPAELTCEGDELTGNRVVLRGLEPGDAELRGVTRNEPGTVIPCSPEPDGGFQFPDAGGDWPLWSEPVRIVIR